MPRRMLQMFIVSNVYLVYLLFHWYYPWYYPWQLFWRWDKCCKCLSYQIFILQIFYCTDIFPWQMFWRRGKCCKCLYLSYQIFILQIFYCTNIFPGSCSDDEANIANVYLYLANFCFFFVLRVCAKLVDTYHCDMSFVRCWHLPKWYLLW